MKLIIDQQFREIVSAQLEEQHLSRSALARRMGVRPQMVTDYLNGRVSPGPDVIERFFTALGIRPHLTYKVTEPVAEECLR